MAPTALDRDEQAKSRMEKIALLMNRYHHARELGYVVSDESLEAMHNMEIELRRVMFKLKAPVDKT